MKILIINKSDSVGGAAVVSRRLLHALSDSGVDARMLVIDRNCTDDGLVGSYASPIADKAAFLAERIQIFLNNGHSRENLFKVDTANFGRDLSAHPWVREADVIMLNWVNQGALSLRAVDKICALGKPVIWTMHDMWNCTGICHHAYGCESFKSSCGRCQYLTQRHVYDLSTSIQKKKSKLYSKYSDNLTFVPVSTWLATRCRESSLMENASIVTIPNAFPIDEFGFVRQTDGDIREAVGKKVVVMGAARLDDPIKGFEYAVDGLNKVAETYPELAANLHLLLYGTIRNEKLIDKIAISHTFLGKVSGAGVLNNIYTQADVVLSTSLYETLPGTLIEGQASGCVPVTFGNGGQCDIVEHQKTGYIARYCDTDDVAAGIKWAVESGISREDLHKAVESKFAAPKVAAAYLDLCRSLLQGK